MSSLSTKFILSTLGACFVLPRAVICSNKFDFKKVDIKNAELTFMAIYTTMTCFDIYNNIYGNTQTIRSKDAEGKLVSKEYHVHYLDFKPCYAIIGWIAGGFLSNDWGLLTMFGGMLIGEAIADAFNVKPDIIAHEINGDDAFAIL